MTNASELEAIQTLVKQGKSVVSAEDAAIIDLAMKAIEERHTATFYIKDALFTEIIRRRHTTSTANLEPLLSKEAAGIKTDFHIELDGYSSREACPRCGSVYGTYEFIQQGMKEHGEEAVRAVFSLEGVSVLQIHPRQNITCQNCGLALAFMARPHVKTGPHNYVYRSANHGYGYCR